MLGDVRESSEVAGWFVNHSALQPAYSELLGHRHPVISGLSMPFLYA